MIHLPNKKNAKFVYKNLVHLTQSHVRDLREQPQPSRLEGGLLKKLPGEDVLGLLQGALLVVQHPLQVGDFLSLALNLVR